MEKFSFDLPDLGLLTKLRIGHDNKGSNAAWLFAKAVVTKRDSGDETVFVGNKWISSKHNLVEEFPAERSGDELNNTIRLSKATYRVYVHTGEVSGAGSDANVFVKLFGAHGDSVGTECFYA